MKRVKRFFLVFAVLMCVVFALWLVDPSRVSADVVLSTVDLSVQQTLGLYGYQIPAYYYTGSTWKSCTFTYYNNSLDYDPVSPNQTMVTDYDFRGYPAGYASVADYINDCIKGMTHLYYVCYLDDVPGVTDNTDLQFSLTPTINISGIAYYRQNINVSRYSQNYTSYLPVSNKLYVSTRFSYAPAPVVSYAMGSSGYASYYFNSPIGHINLGNVANCKFTNIDIYGQHTDENGNDEIFSVGEQNITINRSVPVVDNADSNGRYMYVLSISCPRVSDGYIYPDSGGGSGSSPDYSGQLDDIQQSVGSSNTLLQQILAKLDLIYQKMNQEENVSLTPPQTVGFDSRTKSEIIGGLSSGASAVDSQSVPEAAGQAAGGVWSASDALLASAPGLAGVYMFIFIGGIVSWVIFGKRGG